MSALRTDVNHLSTSMDLKFKNLSQAVSSQLAVFGAELNTLVTTQTAKMDRFENKFLFRMLIAVFGLAVIGISGPVTAVVLHTQTTTVLPQTDGRLSPIQPGSSTAGL
ncbi:uncharacterized protein HMPREF1120_07575 [Exophiala dermatitidis NIH/UT8656]|uniref:Uncharacterized protein n=2 Tax=Exophiala dermatitidis TaxID=5970 RepID=H6C794_EXODN|nr:uncharacterized protein HMPREF1120_07575 [Exophiala dermatitidis NIH/UT8656]EHY59590.1 hypothetical protein HMPREF1120_07575 [Exophiala dermatitidis NIH/UT8656]KAJ4522647.1 hypothetical protein HRR75_001041 [Exophiala dermatitidis]KAJ4559614.1 hypothetical protein HRR78_000134 [Exophiala dermatitidis]